MLYDVFVVGATDPSPVAQMHLAARLAEQFHAPAAQIAQAIASRNLRAGQGLDDAQARVLAGRLAQLGAETEFRPAVSQKQRPAHTTQNLPTTQVSAPPTMAHAPAHATRAGAPPTVAGGPTMGGLTLGAPGATLGSLTMPGTDVVGRDPFAGSSGHTGPLPTLAGGPPTLGGGTAVSGPPSTLTPLGRDPFAPPPGGLTRAGAPPGEPAMPKLELGRAPEDSSTELPSLQRKRELGAAVGDARLAADSGVSGVEAVGEKTHMARCPEHGLYYDKRTASSCRKCLEPASKRAQSLARKVDQKSFGYRLHALREDPARHAFYGLALALFIGLVPAAVHALRFGRPAVEAVRSEQAKLSEQVGTQATLDRYNQLDQQAHDLHGANLRNSALVWLVVGGAALFGWHRVT